MLIMFASHFTKFVIHNAPVFFHSLGETRTLDFTFQPGSGVPLDVYFLMDFGTSEFGNEMIDDFFFFKNNLPRICKLSTARLLCTDSDASSCVCESHPEF